MKKPYSVLLLGAVLAVPALSHAQPTPRAVFYQHRQLLTAAPGRAPELVGTAVAPKPGRLAPGPVVALSPAQIDARLSVPTGWVLFQGVQAPASRQWSYLERTVIGNDYRLWVYNAGTGQRELLFDQGSSPAPGLAFKPIAWGPQSRVLYMEALRFDTDLNHEGVWAYDLATRQARRLSLPAGYFSTPLLSPDGQQLLYSLSTAARPDRLHGAADAVAVFSLTARTQTVLARRPNADFTVAGWSADDLNAADVQAASTEAPPAEASSLVAQASAIEYRLPWDAGRTYYVSRHGTPAPSQPHSPSGPRITVYDGIAQHSYAAIDFDTPDNADQNVRAAAAGQVTVASDCGCGYGNLVVVQHADGTRTYYGHNKSIRVAVGQQVQTGTVLGLEGTTGQSSGDHIHFEWRAAGGNASTIGTFADAGQPRQGFPYLSSTPAPGSTPPPATDTQAPTSTLAAVGGTTQSADFTVNFTDADNVGVAERFYQVLENTGAEWRANRGNGFYNDNFGTGALHPDYTLGQADWQGTWAVTTDGRLRQSSLTATNTAATTFLSQTAGNAYLYHFAARLVGDDNTRTGRFGLHLMASDATLRERGNSYLVWFTNDDQKVRIIETINNVLYERASADVVVAAGSFADYKISYSTNSGTIRVFQNNRPVLSWTDATPLTSGSYMSLRTNQAQVDFDDLKVYKARSTSKVVTVGSATSKDARRVSPNSTTPACKVKSMVRDAAGNWSAAGNLDIIIPAPASAATALRADVYPNPLETNATLRYALPGSAPVRVAVLDRFGRTVLSWPEETQAAGTHELALTRLASLAPGTYFVQVRAGRQATVTRVVRQ
ncbi:peptidoglycan DD-metalloendopeptidase family protein [Hymenobacter weizhouensis]|uniref:peptidoglycan DD-metalloendopeptidase family protein n=1 Tax=Hymenobacter sp. YIM 151500-1 TaxID=2987689 RepID=UPI002226C1F6|nr:peptidoglycan DD-metalloendopeptidase family protein [Hymenobacter sp. YIM 151500-1]UYZ61413.1 peptidoglycan DD-metalloendopeptidase family protein [Hymenobacter sp. YIM 151500-1]